LKSIENLFKNPPSDIDATEILLTVAARIAYGSFWLFDNLGILSKLKLLRKSQLTMTIAAMLSWFVGLILTIIISLRKLIRLRGESARIRATLKSYPDRKPMYETEIQKNKAQTRAAFLSIIKSIGDLFPSGIGSGLTLLLPFQLHDGHAGIGGLVSALISCYEIQNRIK
jgi:hypothetical protein